MKLVVTGASGLIGCAFCREVERLGGEVARVTRRDGTDITKREKVLRFVDSYRDADAMVHLAAFTDVSAAWRDRGNSSGLCFEVNVRGTENVVAACEAIGLPLVAVSTDFVFNGTKEGNYSEQDEPAPIEWYGETKLMAERLIINSRVPWAMARISSPVSSGNKDDFLSRLADDLREGRSRRLFIDQIITPTGIDDIVRGLFLFAKVQPSKLFHLVGGSSISPYEMGTLLVRRFGWPGHLVEPSRLQDYLKIDPRPRHRRLEMGNESWRAFAKEHGLPPPRRIDEIVRYMYS